MHKACQLQFGTFLFVQSASKWRVFDRLGITVAANRPDFERTLENSLTTMNPQRDCSTTRGENRSSVAKHLACGLHAKTLIMDINFYGATDQGQRPSNEDHFSIVEFERAAPSVLPQGNSSPLSLREEQRLCENQCLRSRQKCFVLSVADGVGGQVGGELASRLAIKSWLDYWTTHVEAWFQRHETHGQSPWMDFQPFEEDLAGAVQHSHQTLIDESVRNPQYRGMATTLTSACLIGGFLYCAHVGDSRCYVLRGGQLTQITSDHTMAQLIKDSRVIAENRRNSGTRASRVDWADPPPGLANLLWNAVDTRDRPIQPEIVWRELQDRDAILLCTDGLNKHLGSEEIQAIAGQDRPEKWVVEQLISETNRAGGSDNTTIIFGRCRSAMTSPHLAYLTASAIPGGSPVGLSAISAVDPRP